MPPFRELERFVRAQDPVYAEVLSELREGQKRSHWMWFIFPQLAGLGSSAMAKEFALDGAADARRFLAHPILGARLFECAGLVLVVKGKAASQIFGGIDTRKLHSSATLFAEVSPAGSVFHRLLDRFFGGQRDQATLDLLAGDPGIASQRG